VKRRKGNTRHPHAFSKGQGVRLGLPGTWRPQAPVPIQTQSPDAPSGEAIDPSRWKVLKVSPTVATLYRSHVGVAVICADCLHGVGYRNPGLPDRFKREWRLTLLELERRYRCEMCGARNARVYPWWGPLEEGA
jgi:hypothetical protein